MWCDAVVIGQWILRSKTSKQLVTEQANYFASIMEMVFQALGRHGYGAGYCLIFQLVWANNIA